MSTWDSHGAAEDAARAIALGAGADGMELAGWAAYYRRDYAAARRHAEEGAVRTRDLGLRSSCLALCGRIDHSRGDLLAADRQLGEAVAIATPEVRGVAQVWRAQLLVHRGEPDDGVELARRGLLDPRLGHPFAPLHARFTIAHGLAVRGRWSQANAVAEELAAFTAASGDHRFPFVVGNLRGWLRRSIGDVSGAIELHGEVARGAEGAALSEPRFVAHLDLADDLLALGDPTAAAAALSDGAGVLDWYGSMAWRQQCRYRLAAARLSSLGGDHAAAVELATVVGADAAARGDLRYERRAAALRGIAEGRLGRSVTAVTLARDLLPLAGIDGWRDLGELADATRSHEVQALAEALAGDVAASAGAAGETQAAATIGRQLAGGGW